LVCEKIVFAESKEVKTGSHLEEFLKESCGSKMDAWLMIMMMMMMMRLSTGRKW
jgi:hypothetical protein